jgi:uncharacterized protein YhjY with autotransporter beta-barrel domain
MTHRAAALSAAVGFGFSNNRHPKNQEQERNTMSYRTIGPAGALVLLHLSLATPARAQLPPPPSNATGLQQIMFSAVANMCVNALDNHQFASPQVNDLHDQCHAIAGANLLNGVGSAAPDTAVGALQQVSGNEITTQGSLTTRVSSGQFGNITGRLNALRFGSGLSLSQGVTAQNTGFGGSFGSASQTFAFDRASLESTREDYLQPVTLQSAGSPYGGSLISTSYGSNGGGDGSYRVAQADSPSRTSSVGSQPGGVENPWGLFLQGSYNSGRHDQTDNEDPFDFHAASVTAGVDYNFGNAVLGVSVGHDNFDAGIRASGSAVSGASTHLQSTSGSVYGAWFGPAWYFNGIVNYGNLESDLSREVKYTATYAAGFDPQSIPGATDVCTATTCTVTVDRLLTANPGGNALAVGATAGYQYAAFGWDFTPSLSINYRRTKFDAFSETDPNDASDGLGLAFDERTIESLRSILSVQVSKPISVSFGVITPVVRLDWNHEFKTGARSISAHYVYDPSCVNGVCDSNFALPTDTPASNYGVAGAGVLVTLARRVQLFVFDEAQFGYSNYHSNSVTLGVRGQL